MTRNNGKWMALGAVALAGMASPALADLKICNESGVQRTVAIGYKSGDVWTSEGWWILAPGECATTLAGALERRYYYYRAEDDDGAFEGEGYGFCVDSAVFTIPGDQDCDGRGFRAESFSQIDTGPEATTYTFVIAGDGPPALPETPPEPEAPAVAAAPTEPTEPAEPAEPAAPGDGFSSGSFGEPFTQTGQFLGCEAGEGGESCRFQAEGFTYVAYMGSGNAVEVEATLRLLPPGAMVEIEGDIVAYEGEMAEVVLRRAALSDIPPAPPEAPPALETAPAVPEVIPPAPPEETGPELFSEQGFFQGCDAIDGASYCEILVEGFRFWAFHGDGTAPELTSQMEAMAPNTPVAIAGEIREFGDITAQVVLSGIEALGEDPFAQIRADIEGRWRSVFDGAYEVEIAGASWDDLYQGEVAGQYLLQLDAACPGSFGDGPVAVLRGLGNEPELYCYVFDFRDAPQLVLWIPGEGQTLRFDKVN